MTDITQLLDQASHGDRAAWVRLVELIYPDLKHLARKAFSGNVAHTLDTTELAHECYLRLEGAQGAPRDRGHLMSLAVRIMRQVLIDHARERLSLWKNPSLPLVRLWPAAGTSNSTPLPDNTMRGKCGAGISLLPEASGPEERPLCRMATGFSRTGLNDRLADRGDGWAGRHRTDG